MSIKKVVTMRSRYFYKEKKICIFTNYRTGSSVLNAKICDLNNSYKLGEHFDYAGVSSDISKFDQEFEKIHQHKSFGLKLMADHLQHNHDLIYKVLNSVDKIIYLYRRDFIAQAKSFIAAKATGSFHVSGFKESFESKPKLHVPEKYVLYMPDYIEQLKNNYFTMSEFYKKMPGELLCLEDFEVQRPYLKTIIWPGPEPVIEPFDVESLFVKSYEMA